MSKKEIEELRSLVLSERRGERGPFSSALRVRLHAFLKAKLREGESLNQVGEALGLSKATVHYWKSRWSEEAQGAAKLRRVKVISEKPASGRKVTLHGPAGEVILYIRQSAADISSPPKDVQPRIRRRLYRSPSYWYKKVA